MLFSGLNFQLNEHLRDHWVLVSSRIWFWFLIITCDICAIQHLNFILSKTLLCVVNWIKVFFKNIFAFKYIITRLGRILKCNLHNQWRLCHWRNIRVYDFHLYWLLAWTWLKAITAEILRRIRLSIYLILALGYLGCCRFPLIRGEKVSIPEKTHH